MSFTSRVRARVPELLHSSRPWTPSSAMKYRAPPISVNAVTLEPFGPDQTSFTRRTARPACADGIPAASISNTATVDAIA
jgi:hypothetical protein